MRSGRRVAEFSTSGWIFTADGLGGISSCQLMNPDMVVTLPEDMKSTRRPNRYFGFSTPNAFIRDANVVGLVPSHSAAPSSPAILDLRVFQYLMM